MSFSCSCLRNNTYYILILKNTIAFSRTAIAAKSVARLELENWRFRGSYPIQSPSRYVMQRLEVWRSGGSFRRGLEGHWNLVWALLNSALLAIKTLDSMH